MDVYRESSRRNRKTAQAAAGGSSLSQRRPGPRIRRSLPPCRSAMSYHLPTNPGLPILHHAVTRPVPSSFGLGRSLAGGGPFSGPHPRDAWISEQPSRIGANRARCAGYPNPVAVSVVASFKPFWCQAMGGMPSMLGAGRQGSRSADLYIQRGRRGLTARARSIFSRSLPALQASYSGL